MARFQVELLRPLLLMSTAEALTPYSELPETLHDQDAVKARYTARQTNLHLGYTAEFILCARG